MSQATVVSSRAQCETAASAAATFVLSTPWSNSINASWYGFCHFGYFICSFSMEPPSLSEGTFARQRIFGCAKVEKVEFTVSDLGVPSRAQGAVAQTGVA